MRFSVKCNQCGRTFIAETQNYGRMKYRCPYCRSVMVCQFDPPKVVRTFARSVIPVADTSVVGFNEHLPEVGVRLIMPSAQPKEEEIMGAGGLQANQLEAEESLPQASVHQFKHRASGFVGMLNWIWGHLSVFCLWSSKKIQKFQADYEDGDLWIFFAFSMLFVLLVFAGLWTMAEVTMLVSEGQSWLFKNYIKVKNMF